MNLFKSRSGKSFTPVIAVLIIVSGATAGVFLREKQGVAPDKVAIQPKRSALPTSQDAAVSTAADISILANRYSIPLGNDDIDDTVEAPAIAVSDSGIVYVAWATKSGDSERSLMMSRSEDQGRSWIEPWQVLTSPIHVAVSEMRGRRIEQQLHLVPLIATHGEKLFLSWIRGGEDRVDVIMLLATSDDRGDHFSEPIRVHQNDQARPTFASMTVSSKGDVACAWLDNRNEVQQCFMAIKPHDHATFLPEMLVDPGQNSKGICPCCPTTVAFAPDQSVWVAYRGHVDGMRDMWAARWQPGDEKPSVPMQTNKPTWKFDGCPHDGPALIPLQDKTVVAWMDAHQGMSQVFINRLTPNDAGEWFPAEANVIDAGFEGSQEQPCMVMERSSIAATPIIHAAWSATGMAAETALMTSPPPTGSRRAVHYAMSRDGGVTFSPAIAVSPQDDAFQSRVKLVVAPEGEVFVAYFELSTDGKQLVVGRVVQTTSLAKNDASIAGVAP